MKLITTERGQSVKDIAMQYYGDSSGVWDILSLNPMKVEFIDQNLDQGTELWVGEPIRPSVVRRLEQLKAVPATGADITNPSEFSEEFSNEFN